MEGYLNKSTTFSRWKRRYFVLSDDILYYYTEKGGELRGRLHLSISQIKEYEKNDNRFEIDSGLTTISIRAETKESRDTWIHKIKNSQFDHEAYEREYLKRNTEMFNHSNGLFEEIMNLESKLDVIKSYIKILEDYNQKICDLVQQKGHDEEVIALTNDNKVKSVNLFYNR